MALCGAISARLQQQIRFEELRIDRSDSETEYKLAVASKADRTAYDVRYRVFTAYNISYRV